jgi:hypothetical protein
VTPEDFRRSALSLPEALESSHMDHPDFRVRGKVFATLGYPDIEWGMVKLTPEQQVSFVREHPGVFVPAKGAWGRRGSTTVRLEAADEPTVRHALVLAWRNVAPKGLHGERHEDAQQTGSSDKQR